MNKTINPDTNKKNLIVRAYPGCLSDLYLSSLAVPGRMAIFGSFIEKTRDELLAREIFHSVKEAQVLIEMWRKHYNPIRPHSSLGCRSPAPATLIIQTSQIHQVGLTLWVVKILGVGQ